MSDEATPPVAQDAPAGGESPSQLEAPVTAAETNPATTDKPAEGAPAASATESASADPAKDTPAPTKLDADLDDWAKTRGYSLTTDNERKIAQDARNQQREFRNPKEVANALDKTVAKVTPKPVADPNSVIDPLEAKVAKLEADNLSERNARLRSEYIVAQKVTPEESAMMATILEERVAKAGDNAQKVFEVLTDPDNLDIWHDLAKTRLASGASNGQVVEQARAEERERLAKTSNANGPSRAATSTTPAKPETDHERQLRIWGGPAK